jgi:hypothetical protein
MRPRAGEPSVGERSRASGSPQPTASSPHTAPTGPPPGSDRDHPPRDRDLPSLIVGSARGAWTARRVLARLVLVASRRRIESGRRRAHPGASHTTRHAGPHRAVRSAFPEAAVGVGESFQAHGLVPVGVR